MAIDNRSDVLAARAATLESISTLIASTSEEILQALIENPLLNETHVCLLLERKDLSGRLLEEIAKRKTWRGSYRVRLALAVHPHTPRQVAIRMLRDLHLMDLVKVSLLPASPVELRRLAEQRVLIQMTQSPLGQRLQLARRGSSRIVAGLVEQGPVQVVRAALDSAFLTESHLLKTLAKDSLPAGTITAVARHGKWSKLVNVRVALLRHPHAPADYAGALIADLPRREIEDLLGNTQISESVRVRLRHELSVREKG